MKLRNKKTGEIIDSKDLLTDKSIIDLFSRDFDYFNSKLNKIQEEWEDYEEPDEIWYIDWKGDIRSADINNEWEREKEIGNYFETREEAEKAVEKLKAWKRLKDKGFRFLEWYKPDGCEPFIVIETNINDHDVDNMKMQQDLDLLFGGEE